MFSVVVIINFVENLGNKSLILQAKLLNMQTTAGDLKSANNKRGFTILCKLRLT